METGGQTELDEATIIVDFGAGLNGEKWKEGEWSDALLQDGSARRLAPQSRRMCLFATLTSRWGPSTTDA